VCALVATILMVAVGIVSEQEARDSVNWEVYVTIACAFGIGTALENSGVAAGIAGALVSVGTSVGLGGKNSTIKVANDGILQMLTHSRCCCCSSSSDIGVFAAVYVTTALISAVVTNNAAAALIFPVAMDAAAQTGTEPILMAYCVMLGASDYMTPFGYQ
jgi:di/tricarboxylate transporter